VSITFTRQFLDDVAEIATTSSLLMVGWYYSHLSGGIHPSNMDVWLHPLFSTKNTRW
jgi:hypothetical protein